MPRRRTSPPRQRPATPSNSPSAGEAMPKKIHSIKYLVTIEESMKNATKLFVNKISSKLK